LLEVGVADDVDNEDEVEDETDSKEDDGIGVEGSPVRVGLGVWRIGVPDLGGVSGGGVDDEELEDDEKLEDDEDEGGPEGKSTVAALRKIQPKSSPDFPDF
jgi:hypothetical protein